MGNVDISQLLHVSSNLQLTTTVQQPLQLSNKIHKIEYSKKHFFFSFPFLQDNLRLAHRHKIQQIKNTQRSDKDCTFC